MCGSSLLAVPFRTRNGHGAALSMLDGREFEILLAVIFSMGILTGFLLSQAFCKSRGVNQCADQWEGAS